MDPVEHDLNVYLRRQEEEEAEAEELEDYMVAAIEEDLDESGECITILRELVHDIMDPMDTLLANLSARCLDDWMRLMIRCPVADADIVAVNFRDWAIAQLLTDPPPQWIENRARQMMAEDKDDAP